MQAFGSRPPLFVENRGQLASTAACYADGRDLRLALGRAGATVTVYGGTNRPRGAGRRSGEWLAGAEARAATGRLEPLGASEGDAGSSPGEGRVGAPPPRVRNIVYLDFVGADSRTQPVGRDRTPTVVSCFRGPRADWHTGLATIREVVYADLWPRVDLVFRVGPDAVKHSFLVRPGGDPRTIRMAWRGARQVALDSGGALVIRTAAGALRDEAPTAFQTVGGQRKTVPARYDLAPGPGASRGTGEGRGVDGAAEHGFAVGAYDPARTLVIDPAIFGYAGFFGGLEGDRGLGIAVDGQGNAYFCGQTLMDDGKDDAYAVKVRADGSTYDYIAYVGGSGHDTCFDIDVDPGGNAYLTGVAASTERQSFPVRGGPDLTHNGGIDDVLVAKLNPTGTDLVFAGYLGGTLFDFGEGIRVAPDGSAYLSGVTSSSQLSFPVTVGPDLSFNGAYDAYLCKLKPDPTAANPRDNYQYCGYIGGSEDDVGHFGNALTAGHVAIDAEGNAYASGMTRSNEASFPTGRGFGDLPGPDRSHNGDWDAWVAKVKADGTGLAYAGYLGGSGQDEGYGAGVDATGAFYFTGATMSRDFPAVVGPDLSYNGGTSDAFVAKVAPDGSHYVYAGFIGGDCHGDCGPDTDEMGVGLAVDAAGHAYPIGWTLGAGTSFPTVNGPDSSPNGPLESLPDDGGASADAWVGRVKLDPGAESVTDNFDFLGFIGGDRWDTAFWVAVDGRGGVYVVGDSESSATTYPNGGGLGSMPSPGRLRRGDGDAFVAKVVFDPAGPTLTPEPEPTVTPRPVAIHLPWARRGAELR